MPKAAVAITAGKAIARPDMIVLAIIGWPSNVQRLPRVTDVRMEAIVGIRRECRALRSQLRAPRRVWFDVCKTQPQTLGSSMADLFHSFSGFYSRVLMGRRAVWHSAPLSDCIKTLIQTIRCSSNL